MIEIKRDSQNDDWRIGMNGERDEILAELVTITFWIVKIFSAKDSMSQEDLLSDLYESVRQTHERRGGM